MGDPPKIYYCSNQGIGLKYKNNNGYFVLIRIFWKSLWLLSEQNELNLLSFF